MPENERRNMQTLEGAERYIITRKTVEEGAADLFDALPREFRETIAEVHFADGSDQDHLGMEGSYSIDLDSEWYAKVAGIWGFDRPSNLVDVVRVDPARLGAFASEDDEDFEDLAEHVEIVELPDEVDPVEGVGSEKFWQTGLVTDQGREGACFPAGTLVRMSDGSHKPIDEIRLLDNVATAEGRTGRVLQLFARDHEDGLVNVRLKGHNLLRCTPNHPILTKRGYVAAEELRKGDEVALTRSRPGETREIRVSDWVVKEDYGRRTNEGILMQGGVLTEVSAPPETIPLSKAFGRLIGLYLAEGGNTPNKVQWTFGPHEEHTLVAETADLIREVLGAEPRIQYRRPDGERVKCINVVLYGKLWCKLFERLFGENLYVKGLPGCVASGPDNFAREVFDGWMDGDGHARRNERQGITVSYRLALDMYAVAQRLGMRPALWKSKAVKNRYARTRRDRYELTVRDNPGGANSPDEAKSALWRKVREVLVEPFVGVVYNMHVEGDESYVADGVGVHNCVGHTKLGFLTNSPVRSYPRHSVAQLNRLAYQMYKDCQRNDEWPGENYSGTSVVAACRTMIRDGQIQRAGVTSSFDAMTAWKLRRGPLMMSLPWFEGCYRTDSRGFIRPTGRKVGGHAILDYGVSRWLTGYLKNSWGLGFGIRGTGYVAAADYRWWMRSGGRAYTAIQVKA